MKDRVVLESALYSESQIFSLCHGLNWGPSDPEDDDITMCHSASLG